MCFSRDRDGDPKHRDWPGSDASGGKASDSDGKRDGDANQLRRSCLSRGSCVGAPTGPENIGMKPLTIEAFEEALNPSENGWRAKARR